MTRYCDVVRQAASILVLSLGVHACAPGEGSAVSGDAGSGPSADPGFFVALGNVASSTDPNSFKILAHAPGRNIDPSSVRFCFSTLARCVQGEGSSIGGAVAMVQGRQVFFSEKYVKLRADLQLTVIGKDQSGAELTAALTIVDSSKQAVLSQRLAPAAGAATASTTAPATASTTALSTSTLTSLDHAEQLASSTCDPAKTDLACEVELEIARLSNLKRQQMGLTPLSYDTKIAYVSRLWSEEMARTQTLSHEWFTSGVWQDRYREAFQESPSVLTENVAVNLVRSGEAKQIAGDFVDKWWNSAAHQANLLDSRVTTIGVGYAAGADGAAYATQNFGRP